VTNECHHLRGYTQVKLTPDKPKQQSSPSNITNLNAPIITQRAGGAPWTGHTSIAGRPNINDDTTAEVVKALREENAELKAQVVEQNGRIDSLIAAIGRMEGIQRSSQEQIEELHKTVDRLIDVVLNKIDVTPQDTKAHKDAKKGATKTATPSNKRHKTGDNTAITAPASPSLSLVPVSQPTGNQPTTPSDSPARPPSSNRVGDHPVTAAAVSSPPDPPQGVARTTGPHTRRSGPPGKLVTLLENNIVKCTRPVVMPAAGNVVAHNDNIIHQNTFEMLSDGDDDERDRAEQKYATISDDQDMDKENERPNTECLMEDEALEFLTTSQAARIDGLVQAHTGQHGSAANDNRL
jgi:hypothetical protein